MIDLGWLYAIVGSSAAFVAIVSAFFTTKILEIGSERRQVLNELDSLRAEILERESLLETYKEEIDAIHYKWAERDINPFLEGLKVSIESPEKIPSVEDLIKLYEEHEETTVNNYEKDLLQQRYAEFYAKAEAASKEKQERRKAVAARGFMGMLYPIDLAIPIAIPTLGLKDVILHERQRLDEVSDKCSEENSRIKILQTQERKDQSRLKSIYFPKYIAVGVSYLILLVVVGVALPLAYVLWADPLQKYISESGIFFLFLIGLGANLSYMCFEIIQALRS
jgi:hypothetical protein